MLDGPACFNPLDREICIRFSAFSIMLLTTGMLFQSPRSGKFVSDEKFMRKRSTKKMFQSPRSGKFVSDKGASVRHLNGKTSVSIP